MRANQRLRSEVEELEHKSRRRDILVDDETLFAFYDRRIGQEVVSVRHFDSWWKKAGAAQPELLNFEKSMLIKEGRPASARRITPTPGSRATFACVFPISLSRARMPTA